MDSRVKQAYADFERFLSGASAPALVGHSLATIVRQDVRQVAACVVRDAYERGGIERVFAARDRVFDIFFYRIVRFKRVYEFFPRFEAALLGAVPKEDKEALADFVVSNPWQEIRPFGEGPSAQEFALQVRREPSITTETFNENLYRNATYHALSADKRYTFDDATVRSTVVEYQRQAAEVFTDFVSLLKDAVLRREILLSNAADADISFNDRPKFQIESYICQLADLGIALFNDQFLEHSVQIAEIVRALAAASDVDLDELLPFQLKASLLARTRLLECSSTKAGGFLLRRLLPLFTQWQPRRLLDRLEKEEDQTERKFALAVAETYGQHIFPDAVDALERADVTAPWNHVRDLAYLLSRIVTLHEPTKGRAVRALAPHLRPGAPTALNLQIVSALGNVGSEPAAEALALKLAHFEREFGKSYEATEVCHRIAAALLASGSPRAQQAAFNFCVSHELIDRFRDSFARSVLAEPVRQDIEARIRREMRKLKLSFSFVGDSLAACSLLSMYGSASYPDVAALCDEIARTFPSHHELADAAARLRAQSPLHGVRDESFDLLLAERNVVEAIVYGCESGVTGHLAAETLGGITCGLWLRRAEVRGAIVPALFLKGESAFFWVFSLDEPNVAALRFDRETPMPGEAPVATATEAMLLDGLYRRRHVQEIIGGILLPESRFTRRPLALAPSDFDRFEQPRAYEAVWSVLALPCDLQALVFGTGLSEYEVYRILFDFVRHGMVSVESLLADPTMSSVDDSLTALTLSIRRIEGNPIYFQAYKSAADLCAILAADVKDEAIESALAVLQTYFTEAYRHRRVLSTLNIQLCLAVLDLVGGYRKSSSGADRLELLAFLDSNFPEATRWQEPPEDEAAFIQSVLEQIENIDGVNDPFDGVAGLGKKQSAYEVLGSLDEAISSQFAPDSERPLGGVSLTEQEAREVLEVFGDIAASYVKPLKECVREVERNKRLGRPTPVEWIDLVHPSLELLLIAATKLGDEEIYTAMAQLDQAFKRERRQVTGSYLSSDFGDALLARYFRLEELLPSTFALELQAGDLEAKRDSLIAKFILRQLPEIDDRVITKLRFGGLSGYGQFIETPPSEIAQVADVDNQTAERIFMKFFQYQDIYYRSADPEKQGKLIALFSICLSSLKELHAETERLARDEVAGVAGARDRKQARMVDRQRALWSIFTLLCIRGDLAFIEQVQRVPFEARLGMIEGYFNDLVSAPLGPAKSGSGDLRNAASDETSAPQETS
jgi:hypothetical protein